MSLGYDGKLYILAFDHRGSFQKKMFRIQGDPTPEETETISDAKKLIYEGMEKAVKQGLDPSSAGVLVDEQFGSDIPELAPKEYGDEFGDHIAKYDLLATKVLVRHNPDGDAEMNERQTARLKRLADWLHANDRKFLFELLVPAEDAQLESVGGDADRYDAELRPELMRRVIEHYQNEGVEVDIWKIEGVDTQADAQMLSDQARKGEGRENVKSVLLGRGASDDKVDHWLREAAPVDGFIGFAIGRSIWWDALKGFLDKSMSRDEASDQIAEKYLRFVKVYDEASSSVSA
jgi:myo-inositol catabolism protein IolC